MHFAKYIEITAMTAALILFGGCQPQPKPTPSTPVVQRAEIKHAHADIYQLDSSRSSIKLNVYRDGPLARLGHNHVIAIEQISGTIYREKITAQSEFELSFPVAAMQVDRSDDRAEAGTDFASAVTPEAIAGTRENMLGPKLLAAQQYPLISLRSISISGAEPDVQIVVAIKLREFDSQIALPAHISEQDSALFIDGEVPLSQVQLGLTPYSVLGGGLRVGDTINARFHLVALHAAKN
ncbi:MAG: hypothetical protein JWM78_2506 [Verrucomicrobiaceae bacterium]|nr:hypothetical protein [Verrucomicrobiaceae bacterium]